jgi:LysM repeat protein
MRCALGTARLSEEFAVSSLRPLITITILAAVGVVLYMKINETEPVVPAEVGQWSDAPLAIGAEAASAGSATTEPPAYAAEAAPAFVPGAASAPAAPETPSSDAPAWPGPEKSATPPVTIGGPPPSAAGPTPSAESSPVARTAETGAKIPDMPPLPEAGAESKPSTPAGEAALPVAAAAAGAAVASAASTSDAAADAPPASTPTETAASGAVTPTPTAPTQGAAGQATPPGEAPTENFAAARAAVQAALDRHELAEALQLLSAWQGDPSLTPAESAEVETLLGQLAGSVIYEGPPAHSLHDAYVLAAGETLEDVAAKFNVPWELLAKVNGITDPKTISAGRQLKVIPGPFSALLDLSERKLTLMLDRSYAGKFAIELDPASTIEEGQWQVDKKQLTPAPGGLYAQGTGEDRSLLLVNPANPTGQTAVMRGPGSAEPAAVQPASRVIRLKSGDVGDLYDILSVGSRVTVRR